MVAGSVGDRDTPGEVAIVLVMILVVTGARTEVTGMKAVVVMLFMMVVEDPAWTSPPSQFPPSSSLLDKEEDKVEASGAEEVE